MRSTMKRLETLEARLASLPETGGDTLDLTLLSDGELDLLLDWTRLGRPDEWAEQIEAVLSEAIQRNEHFGSMVRSAQTDWLGRACTLFPPRPCQRATCMLFDKCQSLMGERASD